MDVYERRADPRAAGAERGRSINLAISARGLDALGRIGLDEHVLADALPMRGRTLHPPTGALAFQSYSADGTRAINSISRAGLNARAAGPRRGDARACGCTSTTGSPGSTPRPAS